VVELPMLLGFDDELVAEATPPARLPDARPARRDLPLDPVLGQRLHPGCGSVSGHSSPVLLRDVAVFCGLVRLQGRRASRDWCPGHAHHG